jgi:hypothetical protein
MINEINSMADHCRPNEFRMLPPEPEVAAQAAVNGCNRGHAAHQVGQAYAAQLACIRNVLPTRAAEIDSILADVQRATAAWHSAVGESWTVIQNFCSEAIGHAAQKHELHIAKNNLAGATAEIEDTETDLTPDDFARIQNIQRTAPAKITRLTESVGGGEKRLKELEQETGVALDRVWAILAERAQGDPDLRRIANFFN